METHTPIGQLRQENPVHSVAFSPDGKLLASGGGNDVMIWDVDPYSWATKLCQKVNRNFTQEEWKRFGGRGSMKKLVRRWSEGEIIKQGQRIEK